MTAALTRPEPRRIIPKSVVDALIADADRQISALERQAERAVAAADEAEARLDALGIDERASAWATIQLERFVTSLRADVAVESDAILAEARVRAQRIVDEASYDADVRNAEHDPGEFDPMFPPLESPSEARFTPVQLPPLEAPVPEVVVPPVAVVPEVVPPAVVAPVVVAPDVIAPAVEAVAPESTPVVEATGVGDSVFAAIAPESLEAPGSVDLAPSDTSFWSDPPERKHRFRRPASRTVAIQCSALGLLIAAVVVRFG